MSRFFQQEQSESEKEEQAQVIQEEPKETNKKKKKKKNKAEQTAQPQEQIKQENQETEQKENPNKKTKKKAKPQSAMALKAQQILEEKKLKDQQASKEKQEKLLNIFENFLSLKNKEKLQTILQIIKQVYKKQQKIIKEKQEAELKALQARKYLEERQKQIQQLLVQKSLNQDQNLNAQETKKGKKKKLDKYDWLKNQQNIEQDEQVVQQQSKDNIQKQKDNSNSLIPQQQNNIQQKQEIEDDWENLIENNNTQDEQKTEQQLQKKQQEDLSQIENQKIDNSQKFESLFVNDSKYWSPVICILGHVDTGKTKILDHIRNTKVQDGEEGGITQQIGASFFPSYKLKEEVQKLDKKILDIDVQIPGFLIIDTPGHESFSNLRSRGSSLCDLAIVVIDIMHSIENQTKESLELLLAKNIPFIIALNKIDRIYGWQQEPDISSYCSYQKQTEQTKHLFNEWFSIVFADLIKLGINAKLYWDKEKDSDYVNMVPTSAITGEGMPDLLGFLTHYCQDNISNNIIKNFVDFKATVMEVKKIEGLGTTIDLIMINGTLKVEDKIVLSGIQGTIVTQVRALLTPHPLKELRVKNEYINHQEIRGSIGVKICAQGLEHALTGSSIYKYETEEQLQEFTDYLNRDINKIKKNVKLKKFGVGVAASTLGSLEALLIFLRDMKIDVSTICIGDVTKNDLLKVLSPFLQEKNQKDQRTEFLTMLCFDVKILPEAQAFADLHKIKIIQAKIIYHLFDRFTEHVKVINEAKKKAEGKKAVFPCILKQVQCFNKKDPLIVGVDVSEGILRVGTPLCVVKQGSVLVIGNVESIELNKTQLNSARRKNGSVAIKIKTDDKIQHGKQIEITDDFISYLTRDSIDKLKEFYRDEMTTDDWNLVRKLKPILSIE